MRPALTLQRSLDHGGAAALDHLVDNRPEVPLAELLYERGHPPYLWHNGQYPDSDEHKALFDGHFADYRLRINGLVDHPVYLDLAELRRMPYHQQITQHSCIRGWSGVAKWGGVSMQTVVDRVKPHSKRSGSSSTPSVTGRTRASTTTPTRSSTGATISRCSPTT